MNRENAWVAGVLLVIIVVLAVVNLVLWPPNDPDGPPPGYVIPGVPESRPAASPQP
jgi:hypothetical protein